jgi:metal-responsive CopG/Arc/MetJ family transcriptional regulator
MSETKREVVVMLNPETVAEIDGRLDYGDSRSAWIRRAVRDRLQVDDAVGAEQ